MHRLLMPVFVTARDLAGGSDSVVNRHQLVACELQTLGLKPGDSIGYIGHGIRAYWPSVAGVRIITEIAVGALRRRVFDFDDSDDDTEIKRFWESAPADRDRVLETMKRCGANAVIADAVPVGANTSQWIKLKNFLVWRSGEEKIEPGVYRDYVYVRFLRE